jgi:hypothetical protein
MMKGSDASAQQVRFYPSQLCGLTYRFNPANTITLPFFQKFI